MGNWLANSQLFIKMEISYLKLFLIPYQTGTNKFSFTLMENQSNLFFSVYIRQETRFYEGKRKGEEIKIHPGGKDAFEKYKQIT